MKRTQRGLQRVVRTIGSGAIVLAAMGAAHHITPTVVLRKQADVIRGTLPEAASYYVRTVEIGRQDLERIRARVAFDPDDPEVKFYYGKDANGEVVGVVLFAQANTQHGPVEVGLTFGPDGRVTRAVATKATVETKPWVLKAVRTGFMEGFVGLAAGDDPSRALEGLSRAGLGRMPYYFAQVIARAVRQGLVLYEVLYAGT